MSHIFYAMSEVANSHICKIGVALLDILLLLWEDNSDINRFQNGSCFLISCIAFVKRQLLILKGFKVGIVFFLQIVPKFWEGNADDVDNLEWA